MSDEIQPLGYTIDEAAKRLRKPRPSRGAMYSMIRDGVLTVSGYIGDRPFFTDAAIQECAERLRDRRPGRPPAATRRLTRTR
jgi:hypothetical protein